MDTREHCESLATFWEGASNVARYSQAVFGAVCALATSACAADGGNTPVGDGSGTAPAVMVSVVVSTPESRNFYVGAYPELPGEIDLSKMLELGSGGGYDARAFNGYVYVWDGESATYTRFAVDDSLRLTEGPAVSFANLGGTGTVMTSFVSPTRAYSMTRDNMQIVVWDPSAMEVIGSIATDAAIDPDYPELDYGEPVIFDGYVAWPVLWYDYDRLRFKSELGVILASTSSEAPAFVVRDSRCGGGWSLFTDTAGDLYATGNAWFGFAHFFGDEAQAQPHDCVLRIKSGSTAFDPDYYVDLNRAAGTPAVYHTWHVSGHSLFAAVWDPEDDPGALGDPDAYWSAPLLRKLVRIDGDASVPVTGIPKSAVASTLNYRLDGTLFMLVSEGVGESGEVARSSLYGIADSQAVLALSTPGDIWSSGRIR